LMMGIRMPETCWAVFKQQAIKLRYWCIWLVDLFEYMMMIELTNPKGNINSTWYCVQSDLQAAGTCQV
jgi:hypothetical protein